MNSNKKAGVVPVPVHRSTALGQVRAETELDLVAVEEPLQIQVNGEDLAITMRTPGHDRDLAAGFLYSEGLLQSPDQIQGINLDSPGVVSFMLKAGEGPTNETAQDIAHDANSDTDSDTAHDNARRFAVTSSCGVCGRTSIDQLREMTRQRAQAAYQAGEISQNSPSVDALAVQSLPAKLREAQKIFEHTGGLHAAALFTGAGDLIAIREDVGRHNAVDKLIGAALLGSLPVQLPLRDCVLMLSGRISFELVQKAAMAGIPIIAAVGAPSSLAVETALRFRITLIGFLREDRFNVYAGAQRIRGDAS
jgi:FdhD protein